MPTQATQTDEENIIILDDVESDTSNEIKIEEPTQTEEIIDFGDNTDDNNDLSLDLGDVKSDSSIENKSEDSSISNESFDLGDFNLEDNTVSDNTTSNEVNSNETLLNTSNEVNTTEKLGDDISLESDLSLDGDSSLIGGSGFQDDLKTQNDSSNLNSILDETIVKLQSRSDIISEDKALEQNNIKDYKSQISDLESSVNNSEGIVSELNKEAAKIRSNIKSLERMKLKDEVEEAKKQTSVKAHNSKRTR